MNGRKIVVNVTQIKPYFSSTPSLFSNDDNGFLHLDTDMTTDTVSPSLGPPSFIPPPLSLAHSRRPSRPHKTENKIMPSGINLPSIDKKVLSPTPTVSFSKRGKDSPPVGMPPADKTVSFCMHASNEYVLTCSHCNDYAHCT
jgi:hypothetical protein